MVLQKNGQLLIKLLIPAAGKGERTGLNFPKTIYRLNNKPILINILDTCHNIDNNPIIISSPKGVKKIEDILKEYSKKAEILIQNKPTGMADAVIKVSESKEFEKNNNFLLIWSDLISPNINTILKLIENHFKYKNDFSIATIDSRNCYSKVYRESGKLLYIEELKGKNEVYHGERDVGIFIINKIVIDCLKKNIKKLLYNNETSFLKSIAVCIQNNLQVEAYKIATKQDLESFNSFTDIKT